MRRADVATRGHTAIGGGRPLVVSLGDPTACDPHLTGAKAAALARASAVGLPVLPGAVLTTHADVGSAIGRLRSAWERLAEDGRRPLAVRSSSTVEDTATSSMAGVFDTVLDVEGWDALLDAIATVRRSAGDHPMAVLVQPMLDSAVGGVLFGLDPVTGRPGRLVVEVVPGNPSALVSGLAAGTRYVLGRHGRLLEADRGDDAVPLPRHTRRALSRLAARTAATFGAPQDVEWSVDRDDRLWLLQSRPVTATAAYVEGQGALLGPGPVAETLPDVLSPLEADLWVDPLRTGVAEAVRVLGVTGRRALASSPVVTVVGGRVAADLTLLDPATRRPRGLRRLDVRPPARRLAAAWRVGRLRAALPALAADLTAAVDGELAAVPPLGELDDRALLALLDRARLALRSVHGHEVLAGVLGTTAGPPAAAVALAELARARAAGLDDATAVARHPVLLALTAPKVGRREPLPDVTLVRHVPDDPLAPREALRLRARWLQELTARAVEELGERFHVDLRVLRLEELADVLVGGPLPADLAERSLPSTPPLPARFRLGPGGEVVAEAHGPCLGGRGAGGGRAMGMVGDGPGTVLVVRALEPGLAAELPGRAALVAETGSTLSHLAILSRELGVPAVVGVPDAVERFPPGTTLVVDGTTGEVAKAGS